MRRPQCLEQREPGDEGGEEGREDEPFTQREVAALEGGGRGGA